MKSKYTKQVLVDMLKSGEVKKFNQMRVDTDHDFLDLSNSNLRYSHLSNSDLRGSDLSNSNLSNSNLRGSDLSNSNLSGSNLRGSDLRGSNLRYSNLRGSNLRYSHLSNSNLRGSDLRYSNLRYSNLSGSNLSGSDLSYSNLSYSNLSGSDLSYSHLSGSDLRDSKYSIQEMLQIDWRMLSDKLILELMRHDAEFIGNKLMNKWSKGGPCPYEKMDRDFKFAENSRLWSPGVPKYRGHELIIKLFEEKNIKHSL